MTGRRELIIARARELLRRGIPASELAARLMSEFDDLTPGQARKLARAAIERERHDWAD